MIRVALPRAFRTDRMERDLPIGTVLTPSKRGTVLVEISEDDAREYLNDAEYYANPDGPECGIGLKSSARATVTVLRAALT